LTAAQEIQSNIFQNTQRETFVAAGFQRAGKMDVTSREGVLQRNYATWWQASIPFSYFLASNCLESCATCSVQFWFTLSLLSPPEEISQFPSVPSHHLILFSLPIGDLCDVASVYVFPEGVGW